MSAKIPKPRAILKRISALLKRKHNRFLWSISGVIHVGAHAGEERDLYEMCGLRVLWIEPNPEIFEILQTNIKGLHRQRAIEALVTDCDDENYQFHISSNHGASSSILDLNQHKDIWPQVHYIDTISLTSTTLSTLLQRNQIDPSDYQALILDTQGSELLVLKGAVPILENFEYVTTEVPDFESYTGCCQLADIKPFMIRHGYREYSRRVIATRAEGGSYYDISYRRKA